jgi:stage V sporulation protein SpoVS
MSTQEPTHQERLGGDAPLRISARSAPNGSAPARANRVPEVTRSLEFLVMLVAIVAVLAAAAIASGFGAERAWTLVTVLAAAFILSRR